MRPWCRGSRWPSALAVAFAHGGGPVGLRSGTDLTAAAAKQLGVSTATLEKAILDDAGPNARIDKAVKDGTLDEDQAADLTRTTSRSHVQFAVGLTTATGVARNLKITKAKLDSAYQAARKADLLAKLDQAVQQQSHHGRPGRAGPSKAKLDEADLPGYKPLLFGGGARLHGGMFGVRLGGRFGGPLFGGPITGGAKQQPAARAPGSARS